MRSYTVPTHLQLPQKLPQPQAEETAATSLASKQSTCTRVHQQDGTICNWAMGWSKGQRRGNRRPCLQSPSAESVHMECVYLGYGKREARGTQPLLLIMHNPPSCDMKFYWTSFGQHVYSWAPDATLNNSKIILSCCRSPTELLY